MWQMSRHGIPSVIAMLPAPSPPTPWVVLPNLLEHSSRHLGSREKLDHGQAITDGRWSSPDSRSQLMDLAVRQPQHSTRRQPISGYLPAVEAVDPEPKPEPAHSIRIDARAAAEPARPGLAARMAAAGPVEAGTHNTRRAAGRALLRPSARGPGRRRCG